jgi:fructoselysine 6-kinase
MRLVGIGDNCADRYPQLGMMFPGGNTLNVAVFARRSGAEAGYVGVLADDAAGACMHDALRAEDVDTRRLRVVPGLTAYATVEVVDGERFFGPHDVGVSIFVPSSADHDYVAGFDLAHTGDCSGMEAHVGDLAARCKVSFDFGVHRDPAYARPLLGDVFVAEFSASDLDEDQVEALVHWAYGHGPTFVLATRGPGGAVLFDGRRAYRQPALPTRVVDTLGAGDAFIARTLVGLVGGEPIPQTLQAAAELAARTCAEVGAFDHGVPIAGVASGTAVGPPVRASPHHGDRPGDP